MPYRSGPLHAPESLPRRSWLRPIGVAIGVAIAVLGATRWERERRHRAWVFGAGARFAAQVDARTMASGEQISVLRGEGARAVVVRLPGRFVRRGTDLVRVPEVVPAHDAVALMPGGAWAIDARGNLFDASSAEAVAACTHRPCMASHVPGHGRVVRIGANGVARLSDGSFARRDRSSFEWDAVDARDVDEVVEIDPHPNGVVVPDRRRVDASTEEWTNDFALATLRVPDPVEVTSSFVTEVTCVRGRRGDVRCGDVGRDWRTYHPGCGGSDPYLRSRPIELNPARSARRVAVGANEVCLIGLDRRLSCGVVVGRERSPDGAARVDLPPVVGLGEVSDVAMTHGARCALDRAGEVRCWGAALQHGGVVRRDAPVAMDGLDAVERLVSVGPYACALQRGTVLCWGGPPSWSVESETPRGLRSIPGLPPVAELVADRDGLCVALRDGGLRCWDHDPFGAPQVPDGGASIVLRSLALTDLRLVAEDAGGRAWSALRHEERPTLRRTPFWDGFDRITQASGETCAIRGDALVCDPLFGPSMPGLRTIRVRFRSYLPRLVPPVGRFQLLRLRNHEAGDWVDEVDETVRAVLGGELRAYARTEWPASGDCAVGLRGQVACRWRSSNTPREDSEAAVEGRRAEERPAALVPGLDDAVELVMTDGGLACVRRAAGRVACWGHNVGGLLTPAVSAREPRFFRLDQLLAR